MLSQLFNFAMHRNYSVTSLRKVSNEEIPAFEKEQRTLCALWQQQDAGDADEFEENKQNLTEFK